MEVITEVFSEFAWPRILEDPGRVQSNAYLVLLGLLAVLALIGLVLGLQASSWARGNGLHEQLLRGYGGWLLWLAIVGILAVALRYTGAPFFAKRLWLVLDLLAMTLLALHFLWYRLFRYAADAARYAEEERRRRFLGGPRTPRGRLARRR